MCCNTDVAGEGKGPPDACLRLENCVPETVVMTMTMQMRHVWQDAMIAFDLNRDCCASTCSNQTSASFDMDDSVCRLG